jgi:hypothetical protein
MGGVGFYAPELRDVLSKLSGRSFQWSVNGLLVRAEDSCAFALNLMYRR